MRDIRRLISTSIDKWRPPDEERLDLGDAFDELMKIIKKSASIMDKLPERDHGFLFQQMIT